MEKYILSIDQGTTSTRAILFNHKGELVNCVSKEVKCLFPRSGWVESDAVEIWLSVLDVVTSVMVRQNIQPDSIDSIGITNQRETTVIWDKKTGMPVYNAIIWQSRQSADICDKYADYKELIHKKTGLLINPYFSASKIRFILDNIENGQERAEKGELMFGTIDSWIIYKFTNNLVHATDVSNASRTMLFNINTLSWDDELCNLFNIPKCMLPEVKQSSDDYGLVTFFSGNDVHIRGVAGDQQAALFGQICFEPGESKNTYGTGCFMLLNTGKKPVFSNQGLLTTIAWQLNGETTYAIEGSVFIGGAVVQWLRDELHMISDSAESETMALSCHSHGVYVVPAFTGLGTPYWDDDARGAVFGLTRGTNNRVFVRASLESIAYQCKDVYEAFKKEIKFPLKSLKVDGGATANHYLMQFQSDILNCDIILPKCLQTTALGAAYLAGLNSGYYKNLDEVKNVHCIDCKYVPQMDKSEVDKLYKGWKTAIKATRVFKN